MQNLLIITEAFPPTLNSSSKLIDELCIELTKKGKTISVLTEGESAQANNYIHNGSFVTVVPGLFSKKRGFIIRGIRELFMPIIFGIYAYRLNREKNLTDQPQLK